MNRAARELRRRFALASQDIVLFSGSLLSNVAVDEPFDVPRAERALIRAGWHDLVRHRPDGILTPVHARGDNFSARITIDTSPTNGLKRVSQIMLDRIIGLPVASLRPMPGRLEDDKLTELTRLLALWLGIG